MADELVTVTGAMTQPSPHKYILANFGKEF